MLSEHTSRLPIASPTGQSAYQRLAGLDEAIAEPFFEPIGRFIGRLFHGTSHRVSELPEDLYSDVGLIPPAQQYADGFWQTSDLSATRSLSL